MMTNIQQFVKPMTLEEKAALCTGATSWQTVGIEHYAFYYSLGFWKFQEK
jgi:hypothetical protein